MRTKMWKRVQLYVGEVKFASCCSHMPSVTKEALVLFFLKDWVFSPCGLHSVDAAMTKYR